MQNFLRSTGIILLFACVIFIALGIYHISQTIGDTNTPVYLRNAITYIALFVEIGFGAVFGFLGYLCLKKSTEI